MDSEATSSLTSKGQVTIPKALRQQLGLARGNRVSFQLVGDHIEVRPLKQEQSVSDTSSTRSPASELSAGGVMPGLDRVAPARTARPGTDQR